MDLAIIKLYNISSSKAFLIMWSCAFQVEMTDSEMKVKLSALYPVQATFMSLFQLLKKKPFQWVNMYNPSRHYHIKVWNLHTS